MRIYRLIAIGIICGVIIFFQPVSLFLVFFISAVAFLIYKYSEEKDKNFLLFIFLVAVGLRIFLCLIYQSYLLYSNFHPIFDKDGEVYLNYAWYISSVLTGRDLSNLMYPEGAFDPSSFSKGLFMSELIKTYKGLLPPAGAYQMEFYTYAIALLYSLFGYVPLAIKLMNIVFGALIGIFIYFVARDIFGSKVAKLASIIVIFFPSLFLWSISGLKDTLIILILTVSIWAALKFYRTVKLRYFILTFIFVPIVYQLRRDVIIPILFISFLSTFAFFKKKFFKKALYVMVIAISFLALKDIWPFSYVTEKLLNPSYIIITQKGYAFYHRDSATNYTIYPERIYENPKARMTFFEFISALGKGLVYSQFSPFPWRLTTKLQCLTYPQIVLWYVLMPFTLLGILIGIRYYYNRSFLLLFYLIFMIVSLALVEGNIGTAFRHRDLVTPFALIFSSVGIAKIFGFKLEGIPDKKA